MASQHLPLNGFLSCAVDARNEVHLQSAHITDGQREDNLQSRTVLHVIAPFDVAGWRHRSCFGRAAEGSSAGQSGGP